MAQSAGLGKRSEGVRTGAGEDRCDEHEHLVDQVSGEEGAGQRGPAFQEKRPHALRASAANSSSSGPERSSSSEPSGSGPLAERKPPRLRFALDIARGQRRIVGPHRSHPDGDGVGAARSSCTRRRLASPETQREPGTVTRPSSVVATL